MGQTAGSRSAVNMRAIDLIRTAVKGSGRSVREVAETAGLSPSTLANFMSDSNIRPVYVEQLVRVALALEVDPAAWVAELERIATEELRAPATVSQLPTMAEKAAARRTPQVQKRAARKAPGPRKMGEE